MSDLSFCHCKRCAQPEYACNCGEKQNLEKETPITKIMRKWNGVNGLPSFNDFNFSESEMAQILGIAIISLRKRVRMRIAPTSFKIGRVRWFPKDQALAYLKNRTT